MASLHMGAALANKMLAASKSVTDRQRQAEAERKRDEESRAKYVVSIDEPCIGKKKTDRW